MAWDNIATTVTVLAVGSVIAFGGYTMIPNENYLRIDRTCHPLHMIRDFAIEKSDVKSVGVEHANRYVKLMDYFYDDVCVPKMGKYIYTDDDSQMTLGMNAFRTKLINEGFAKDEIGFLLEKGQQLRINWRNEIEVAQYFAEYIEFKKLTKGIGGS